MELTLYRLPPTFAATYGVICAEDGHPFTVALERPWLGNSVGVSCIPVGSYQCGRVQSPKFGNTFEVKDVPGRSEILFHWGNIDDDTHGCILVGESFDDVKGKHGIGESRSDPDRGFNEFLRVTASTDIFTLHIVDLTP